MERAARLLSKIKTDAIPAEDLARKVWPRAVGKGIAGRSRVAALIGNRLVIEVEDQVWQKQLIPMTEQIVARLQSLLGETPVMDLEFRVAPPRIKVQRETTLPLFDDLPADPVFRHVYLMDRRRRALAS